MFQLQSIAQKFLIPRHEGWEEILEPLIRKITGAREGKTRTAVDYKNEVFKIKSHKFGICRCSYGQRYLEFEENNNHSLECFHTAWQEIQDAFKKHPQYEEALILKTERINMEAQLCRRYKIPYKGGVHTERICTCNFKRKWDELKVQHDEDCEHNSPNFWYYHDDIKIWWNKKFFRDAYSNKDINKNQFKLIIGKCIRSVNQ